MAGARAIAKKKKADESHELFPGLAARLAAEDYFAAFPRATAPAASTPTSAAPDEGRLSVDVYDAGDALVLKAPIAGISPEDLEVFVQGDMLTLRGTRRDCEEIKDGRAVIRECVWGAFSRSVILPEEIEDDMAEASLKHGLLTVRLPKKRRGVVQKLKVKSV